MRATQLLMEEHEIILSALRILEAAAAKGASPPPGLIEFFTGFADAHHHHKEEEILFPALEQAGFPRDAGPLAVMLHEHVEGRALIAAMRNPATFAGAAREYAALLRAHIDKENQVLFRLADREIPAQEQRRVDEEFDAFEERAAAERARHEAVVARLAQQFL